MARQNTMDAETKDAVRRAIYEVGFITVLSLLPLVAIAYYQYVEQHPPPPPNRSHTLWDLIYNNTAAGQLAFYAIANWAVVAWIYDLFSYRDARSPEKTCHEAAVVLDRDKRSPFYERVKRLGVATEGRFGETLSQATFVEGLIRHLSRDPIQDREIGRRGGSWPSVSQDEFERCVLRPFFTADEDEKIVSVVWNYFDAVKKRWPTAWEDDGKKYVLNRSTGYLGLMRFFRDAYLYLTTRPKVIPTQSFLDVLAHSKLKDTDFTKDIFIPGSSGQAALAARLREDCL